MNDYKGPLAAAAASVALGLLLGGCVGTQTPQYDNTVVSRVADTAGGAPRVSGRVGLVISGNTEKSVAHLQENIKKAESVVLVNTALTQDLDPVYLHARLLAALKQRYPDIALQPDVASSARAGNALTVTADVRTAPGRVSGDTTNVEINLIFSDARARSVAKLTGRGSSVIPYPAWDTRLQQAADGALADLTSKL